MLFKVLNEDKKTYKKRCIDLTSYCFKASKREDLEARWDTMLREEGTIIGALQGETVASSITITNRNIYLYGNEISMGGIGEVATAAPYRSAGVCSKLMKHCLEYMNEEGMVFSLLAPFLYEFYEKFGYKWCFNFKNYELPVASLKGYHGEGSFETITGENLDEIKALYADVMKQYNGCGVRDEILWGNIGKLQGDRYIVLYRHQGHACGYMIYSIDSTTLSFNVHELVYRSNDALKAFFGYIYLHSAQVNTAKITAFEDMPILDMLPNPRVECKLESFMMARIVNVEKALSYYPFKHEGQLTLKVIDEKAPWNNNTYAVKIEADGTKVIEIIEGEADLTIHIRELAQVIIGFRTLRDIYGLGLIEITNSEVFNFFEDKCRATGLYDYF